MSSYPTIAFIGAGNMASSLIEGLHQQHYPSDAIWVTRRNDAALATLAQRFVGIHTTTDNIHAVAHADIVILAIKPQGLAELCQTLRQSIQTKQPLVISIAAGITEAQLQHWLGGNIAIVRCMPNTPACVGCSASALYANTYVNQQQHDHAESIMRAVGMAIWLEDETHLHAVTALSGGGPAYIYCFMEALIKAGINLGLPAKTAELLTLQTVFGAAKLALESNIDISTLRTHVTSPGGTTEQAIQSLSQANIADMVNTAIANAAARSVELAEQFNQQQDKE